jgi:hypothetical protein
MMDAVPFVTFAPYNIQPQSNVFLVQLDPGFDADSISVGPEISSGLSGFYDYKTNSETNIYIQVDPADPTKLHAIDIYADSLDAAGASSRRTKYSISTDGGATWSYVVDVPDIRSGFSVLHLTSAGAAVISNHNQPPAAGRLDTYLYVDVASQAGSFTEYGHQNAPAPWGIWPQIAVYSNNNVGIISRRNTGTNSPAETLYYAVWNGTSIGTRTPLYITGPNWQGTVGSNMAYHIGTNGSGRVTAIIRPVLQDDTLFNSKMWQRTSTDNGVTWGAPQVIFTPYTINGGQDTVATAGGSGFIYKKNTDRWFLAFPVTNDNLYEHARLMFRKSNGDTTTIVTRSQVGATISYNTTMSFVFNIDFPALGWSADGTTLYCVYSVVMPDTSRGFNQRDLFMQYSLNEGSTWSNPLRLTNTINIDETYPSISFWNKGSSGGPYEANIVYMKDPGVGPTSFGGGTTPPASMNTLIYRKLTGLPPIGISGNSSIIKEYALAQNYPNPFNPSTLIKFAVPKSSNVTLKVYDIIGRVVSTLVNNVSYKAGEYEVNFAPNELSSGIYFYTISAGEFTQTRKMIFIK